MSHVWQYLYVEGQVPQFTPDVHGTYVLQLAAALAFPDWAYPNATPRSRAHPHGGQRHHLRAAPPRLQQHRWSRSDLAPVLGLALGLGLLIRRRRSSVISRGRGSRDRGAAHCSPRPLLALVRMSGGDFWVCDEVESHRSLPEIGVGTMWRPSRPRWAA